MFLILLFIEWWGLQTRTLNMNGLAIVPTMQKQGK